ncbi:hypothetical protein FHX42_000342 [Saccharopolyspora lacisalsi]|uniref:Uncharacterized protein n=1 Tax=Halosaccharopolyspora lacisalsi TaxID=1000566 RepID=A0A839DPN0_9PSEU|nr:hypothetical protein [Halosaccharopolyspora lacisalsi]MBA8823013.1 hypothetical protein [Halosaccharopolyspora lacisalsi]
MTTPQWWQQLRAWWEERHLRRQWAIQARNGDALRRQSQLGAVPAWHHPEPNDTLRLVSADDPLSFDVRVHVGCYRTNGGQLASAAHPIAREGIRRRAESIAARYTLARRDELRDELETEFCRPREVPETGVQAWAHCVAVEADPELVEAVERRDEARRRQLVASWQGQQRRVEEQRLRELLTDPTRATAWWFAENQDKPERLLETARNFQQLRDVLEPAPGDEADSVGRVVDDYVTDADPAQRDYLVRRLNAIFKEAGRSDLADRVYALPSEDMAGRGADAPG